MLATSLFFGSIAEDVVTNDTLVNWDRHIAAWIQSQNNSSLTRIMVIVTQLGGFPVVVVICAITGLLLWRRHSYPLLIALILAVPGGMTFNLLLKIAFHRDRPPVEHPFVPTTSYSFPSGHTMAATTLYGFLVIIAFSMLRKEHALPLALAAALMIAAVAVSRIYLGAHYLSDVLGAIAAGLAWLTFSFRLVSFNHPTKQRSVALKTHKGGEAHVRFKSWRKP